MHSKHPRTFSLLVPDAQTLVGDDSCFADAVQSGVLHHVKQHSSEKTVHVEHITVCWSRLLEATNIQQTSEGHVCLHVMLKQCHSQSIQEDACLGGAVLVL